MTELASFVPSAAPRQTGLPDFVVLGQFQPSVPLVARARLLGSRIETRELAADAAAAASATDVGLAFVFRYGVVVTIGPATGQTNDLDAALWAHVMDPTLLQELEAAHLEIRPDGGDKIGPKGQVQLTDANPDRLLLVSIVLARSVVLARDEILLSEAFDRIAPLVGDLREKGRVRLPIRPVMQLVGDVLAARHRVMGTAQVDERPDVLWDHPEFDRLYTRLEAEYELKERTEVLERKLGALGDFTEVLLEIVQDKRAYRVEIVIIALIAFEIFLTLFSMAVH